MAVVVVWGVVGWHFAVALGVSLHLLSPHHYLSRHLRAGSVYLMENGA